MKKHIFSLLGSAYLLLSVVFAQQVQTVTVYPYDAPNASGYVNDAGTNYSGDLLDISSVVCIGSGTNSGFVMFDASAIPAGAMITAATIELYVQNWCTNLDDAGYFGLIKGLPVNTLYGKTSKEQIEDGPVYGDKLDWGVTSSYLYGPMVCPLTNEGIAALQKKIGAAFCVGIQPPSGSGVGSSRDFGGYNSTSLASKPALRVSFQPGSASKPSADFMANIQDTVVNSEIRFYDNSGNYPTSWFWEFGDDSTSTLQNPVHIYADTGYYSVKLTAKNTQGEDVMTKPNFIHITPIPPAPVAEFEVSLRSPSENETVNFSDLSVGYITDWEWDFGDDETSTQQSPSHAYTQKGLYTVILIVSSPFGADTLAKENFMNVGGEVGLPVADFSYSDSTGLTMQFMDESSNFPDQWNWDFGDGSSIENKQNPVHAFASEGTYNVCLEAINTVGSDTLCKQVAVIKTGLSDDAELSKKLKAYPNPFHNRIQIDELDIRTPDFWMELYDTFGKKVMRWRGVHTESINLSELPKGLYLLRLTKNMESLLSEMMIKE